MTHFATCSDAVAFLQSLPAHSVDAIITDPPYGTNDGKGKRSATGDNTAAAFALEWDTLLPLEWLSEVARVLRPGGACMVFTDAKRPGDVWDAGERAGLKPRHTFYWTKPDAPPTPRRNFASAVEVGVFFVSPGGDNIWHGGGWCRNVVDSPLAHKESDGQRRFHPTQKPIKVMRWLVELVTNPGDLVVDPFCGSGTTGVACVVSGRRFAGCDISERFAQIANDRMAHWAKLHREAPDLRPAEHDDRQADLFGGDL